MVHYLGNRRIRKKFPTIEAARAEAEVVLHSLANADTAALKLSGADRVTYVHSMQKLHGWHPDADLNLAVADYVAAVSRSPKNVSLKECVAGVSFHY